MQDEAYTTAQGATLIFILHGIHLSKYKHPHEAQTLLPKPKSGAYGSEQR